MICSDFEGRLEALAEGRLGDRAAQDCREHAARCSACSELLFLAGLGPTEGSVVDLTPAVLAATSGSLCEAVQGQLADVESGVGVAGAATYDEALASHLDHCPECEAIAGVLHGLPRELPALAEVRAPYGFVAAVLRRTLPPTTRWRRRCATAWQDWVRRPRFATELAYALTVALLILVGNPATPLSAMSDTARRALPRGEDLAQRVAPLESKLEQYGESIGHSPAVRVFVAGAEWSQDRVDDLWQSTSRALSDLEAGLTELFGPGR